MPEESKLAYRAVVAGPEQVPGDPTTGKTTHFYYESDSDYKDTWKEIRAALKKDVTFETMRHDPSKKDDKITMGWVKTGQRQTFKGGEQTLKHVYALQVTRGFQRGLTVKQLLERAEADKVTIGKPVMDLISKMEAEREAEAATKNKGSQPAQAA